MVRKSLPFIVPVLLLPLVSRAQQASEKSWRFAVSGDSRNCGDVVMPAIAKSVLEHNAQFYWHLGDFRLGSGVDEDIQSQLGGSQLTVDEYHKRAWDDFIAQQITPFGSLPVHLGIGNHELYMHGTTDGDEDLSHAEFTSKFNKWLGGSKKAYYDWKLRQVEFVSLDNSRNDGFDAEQLAWLDDVLKKAGLDKEIKAIVVGMHRALPNSLACGHSMNGDPYSSAEDNRKSADSGRAAYRCLWHFQNMTGKYVYVIASHSHFYMEDIFNTPYWNHRNEKDAELLNNKNEKTETTLKGWLVGTAGAIRYRLPDNLPPTTPAITYAYGYLLGEVAADGTIAFQFRQITEDSVPLDTKNRFGSKFVDMCFLANRDDSRHDPEESCREQ